MEPVQVDSHDDVGRREDASTGRSAWQRAVAVACGAAVLIGILVTAFAWPASQTAPRDVPVAVVGPEQAVTQLEEQIPAEAFEVRTAANGGVARELIRERDVYGAIVMSPDGPPDMFVSSAASPAVAQILQGVADRLGRQAGAEPAVGVEDVVALPDDDPNGAGFRAAALPMVMGGVIIGVGAALAVAGRWPRITAGLLAPAATGMVLAAVVQTWLGSLDGDYWANAAAFALTLAAMAMTIIGLYALLGRAGIGLAVLVLFLLGNPLSGVATAPELLPSGWGALGQLLPPGAGGSLLRSTGFFDGAGAGEPALILAGWLLVGLALAVVSGGSRNPAGLAKL